MDGSDDVLEVVDLHKSFGKRKVVRDVSFRVGHGEIVGLLGPNGAGKSTCFKMTCGLLTPDQGRVRLSGVDVTNWPLHRRAREGGMGYLAQESSVFRKLTVEQNLLGVMEMLGMPAAERRSRCDELLRQLGLTHIRTSRAESLSGGERRRLEIARCLIHRPKIIMLDEPFAAIDPITVQQIQTIIRELRAQGISVWITDHAAREILQVVDRVYVVIAGEVVTEGPPGEVRRHPKVREGYLGNVADSQEVAETWENAPNGPPMRESQDFRPNTHNVSPTVATPTTLARATPSWARRRTSAPVGQPATVAPAASGSATSAAGDFPSGSWIGGRAVLRKDVADPPATASTPSVAATAPSSELPASNRRRSWLWRREDGQIQTITTAVPSRPPEALASASSVDGRMPLAMPANSDRRTVERDWLDRSVGTSDAQASSDASRVRVLRRRAVHEDETLDGTS